MTTINVTVSATSDPWLAGMPSGSTASADDSAPAQSPLQVTGATFLPGDYLSFSATGRTSNTLSLQNGTSPDGSYFLAHSAGFENGISNVVAPLNALVGVFLGEGSPISNPAIPAHLDFSPSGNVIGGVNYSTLRPVLNQVFFIGDGVAGNGAYQNVLVPSEATRLFLGTMDGYGWGNNSGSFNVDITVNPDGNSHATITAASYGGFLGSGGITTDFDSNYDSGNSLAVQSDGKILVAGGDNKDFALVRYNPDGSLDNNFSEDGKVTTDFGNAFDKGNSIAVQADGKILVAGNNNKDFILARYNSDGSLDNSFSGDGILSTDIGNDFEYWGFESDSGNSITVQADGKILVAGTASYENEHTAFGTALVRYNSDGSLDKSFSENGLVSWGGFEYGNSVITQANGKILVAGSTTWQDSYYNYYSGFALTRYNPDGSLDNSFSSDGQTTTDFAGTGVGNSIAVQTNGKILVAGSSDGNFALARYNPDGSLDNSFSSDGKVTTDFGGSEAGNSIAVQADGKILAAGSSDGDFALARYNPDGSLDNSFSSDGKVTTDFGGSEAGNSIAVQADGTILLAGSSDGNFALAHYNPDGSLNAGDLVGAPNILMGGAAADVLKGGGGNQVLYGLEGNDNLQGGDGADTLYGGLGNDTLMGGDGKDVLVGGDRRDFFVFNGNTKHHINGGRDVIADFTQSQRDKIVLTNIDAEINIKGDQNFTFITNHAFSDAGQLRFNATNHVLFGNTDADSSPEFSIQLNGVANLSVADIAL